MMMIWLCCEYPLYLSEYYTDIPGEVPLVMLP